MRVTLITGRTGQGGSKEESGELQCDSACQGSGSHSVCNSVRNIVSSLSTYLLISFPTAPKRPHSHEIYPPTLLLATRKCAVTREE